MSDIDIEELEARAKHFISQHCESSGCYWCKGECIVKELLEYVKAAYCD